MTEMNDMPGVPPNPNDAPGPSQGWGETREPNKDARLWAMFCHLGGLAAFIPIMPAFGSIIGPLVLWLIKKDEFPFVNEQGKEALNFQITMLIYGVIAGLLWVVCIGMLLLPAVVVIDIVFIIVAAIKSNDGYHYRYPPYLIIRFIK